MTKSIKTIVRYDGEHLKDHNIDIAVLIPSLMGLSELIQGVNKTINGDTSKINIKVNAEAEQNCFEIALEVSMSAWGQIKEIMYADTTRDIKEILEWIGIIAGTTTVPTLLWLYKNHYGKPIPKENIIESNERETKIKGDNDVPTIVNNNVINIYQNINLARNAQQFLGALKHEGISTIEVGEDDNTTVYNDEEYNNFMKADLDSLEIKETRKKVEIKNLVIHKAELDSKARAWDFIHDGKTIKVDISQTTIAIDAVERGEVRVGDTYEVELEEQEYQTQSGRCRVKYKALNVLNFKRGPHQTSL